MRRLSKISYVGSHISGDFTIKYMVKTVSLVTHLGNPSFLMQKGSHCLSHILNSLAKTKTYEKQVVDQSFGSNPTLSTIGDNRHFYQTLKAE